MVVLLLGQQWIARPWALAGLRQAGHADDLVRLAGARNRCGQQLMLLLLLRVVRWQRHRRVHHL